MGCSVSHSRRKEKGRAYLDDALVAGKGLGEDRTNGAAAAQSSPPGMEEEGRRQSERRERLKKHREEMEGATRWNEGVP